ncbi:uncharacterized protein LOC124445140 [Xenia sp. Carnegie-2017]|uniref:uncharacterized protein LOC124445140 n=1 Tax=Xenia sp. Carnegie-2017 TaxID=2897299 RepID=UPI001F03736B|nr:uncharacterized protein LOC124445140 [Xenia sp. Carnegie-2017]
MKCIVLFKIIWGSFLLEFFNFEVTSASNIYVSRAKGHDSASCGSYSRPCYSISHGVSVAGNASKILIDSTNTKISPYDCKSFQRRHQGIYVTKNLTFVSDGPSLCRISCKSAFNWIIDGRENATPMIIGFIRIFFENTQIQLVDSSAIFTQCVFYKTKKLAVNFTVYNQNLTSLVFQNVQFEANEACISVKMWSKDTNTLRSSIIFKNSQFIGNGIRRIPILMSPSWSVLRIDNFEKHAIELHVQNTSFVNNYVRSMGMIYVSTNHLKLVLDKTDLQNNGFNDTKAFNSLFVLNTKTTSIVIADTQVKKSKQRLFSISSTRTEILITYTQINDYRVGKNHGGTFYIESEMMQLVMNNCVISNGRSMVPFNGGFLYVHARNVSVHIENSNFTNLKIGGEGGVMYISTSKVANMSVTVKIKILSSNFISNSAYYGGVLRVPPKLKLGIQNSTFISNNAHSGGVVFSFHLLYAKIHIDKSLFHKNLAVNSGGCLLLYSDRKNYGYLFLSGNNSNFTENTAGWGGGVFSLASSAVYLELSCSLFEYNNVQVCGGAIAIIEWYTFLANSVTLLANHTKFTGNSAMAGGAIVISTNGERTMIGMNNVSFFRNSASIKEAAGGGGILYLKRGIQNLASFSISIERSIFEENYGSSGGAINLIGVNGEFSCKHSVFKSNNATYGPGGAIHFFVSNLTINIFNTTFENNTSNKNAGGAMYLDINHGSTIHVDESVFKHNEANYSMGGGMAINTKGDTLKNPQCGIDTVRLWDYNNSVTIKNTKFIENFARNGGAVSMKNGIIYFNNSHFVNNFAHEGGHLINYGSNNLSLFSSTFNNTITHNSSYTETFIHTYSEGPFILHNTTALQEIQSDNPLVLIANGGIVDFDNFTKLFCPVGSKMEMLNLSYNKWINRSCTYRVTILRFVCTQCDPGTYSLQQGHTLGLRPVHPFSCLPCPNGADCLTTIKSKRNFWGYLSKKNKTSLKFTRCPDGYCLGGSKTQNTTATTCAKESVKVGFAVIVLPGYSDGGVSLTIVEPKWNGRFQQSNSFSLVLYHFLFHFWSLQYLLQWLSIYRSPVNRTVNTTEYRVTLKSIFIAPFRKPEEGKSGAVYWQSILIARRFFLTFLSCFITDPTLRLTCMVIICVLALLHHKCVKPFQNLGANTVQTISLLSLAVMANINMYKTFYRFSKEDVSTGWMFVFSTLDIIEMIMLGFIPGILILLFVLGISSLMVRLVFMAIATIRRKMHRHDPTYDELLNDNHEEN